jgi:hypothetical protein
LPFAQLVSSQQPLLDGTQWLLTQALLTQSALPLHVVPSSEAQLFVAVLHLLLRHTAVASVQVPPCRPSLGMTVPASSLGVHVKLLRLQYLVGSVQSLSMKQPSVDGTQCPLVQVLLTHSLALVHSSLVGDAQVWVVELHSPLVHKACAFCGEQVPSCAPSSGMAAPGPSVGLQTRSSRSQNLPLAQSPSCQQPLLVGTQWLLMQLLFRQSPLPVHVVPSADAQVFVLALQMPLLHTAAASVHAPLCSPSFGMGVPACSLVLQVKLVRSQNLDGSVQSESRKQPLDGGTQCMLVQVLVTHSPALVQLVLAGEAQVLVVVLHSPLAHTACAFCCVQSPSC